MVDRIDIVLLGATSSIGMYCIPYLHKLIKCAKHNFSWAVAGKSKVKMKEVIQNIGAKTNVDLSEICVVMCDVEDDDLLLKTVESAKVIINCVSPFKLYGERVVNACLQAGTHYIDVCSEHYFIEDMELKKNKIAKEKGVYVISACGFDGLLYDIGMLYLVRNLGAGVINSVVAYTTFSTNRKMSLPFISYDKWASLIHDASSAKEIKNTREKLSTKRQTFYPKLKRQRWPRKAPEYFGWVVPYTDVNRYVLYRSQRYMYEIENERPIQIETSLVLTSIFQVLLTYLLAIIFFIFTKFEFGRKLLLKFPDIFTLGFISKRLPTEDIMKNTSFEIVFQSEGWVYERFDIDDQYPDPCYKLLAGRICGNNPGYGSTCICLVLAALTILEEKDNLAGRGKGGVYTPGAAFAKTSIIERLMENDFYFSVIINGLILQGR